MSVDTDWSTEDDGDDYSGASLTQGGGGGSPFSPAVIQPVSSPIAAGAMATGVTVMAPTATNAGTTYGLDPSAANNFGLGPAYMSTATLATAQVASNNAPSWWWLVAFLVIVALWGKL